MANGLDPRLILNAPSVRQPFDVGQTFTNILSNIGQAQALERQRQAAPFQQQLLEAQVGQQQLAQQGAQQQLINQQNQSRIRDLAVLGSQAMGVFGQDELTPEKIEQVRGQALLARANLPEGGVRQQQLDQFIATLDQNPELARQQASQAVQLGQRLGVFGRGQGLTAAQRERESNLRALEGGIDANTGRLKPREQLTPAQESAAVDLGLLSRRALTPEELAQRQQLVGDVKTTQQVERAAGVEAAKLAAQLKLSPEVKGAVVTATEAAKNRAKVAEEERSANKALAVYEAGIEGLSNALGQTTTGPIVGRFFALTESQQSADGAVAAMAPILKQMFRSAGEGNFTDADQRLLLEMIPTRTDSPGARQSKLRNIDAIVRAKLGTGEEVQQTTIQEQTPQGTTTVQETTATTPQFQEGQTATHPQTGERVIFRNGQWVPFNG